MLLIILKNGDTQKVGIHNNYPSLQAAAKRSRSTGYIQYETFTDFTNEDDPWIKRMLLVEGRAITPIGDTR